MFSFCAHLMSFFFVVVAFLHFNFFTASIGLDWKKLKELLNPKFKWKAAVQRALGPDYSLKKVCCLVFCGSYVLLGRSDCDSIIYTSYKVTMFHMQTWLSD